MAKDIANKGEPGYRSSKLSTEKFEFRQLKTKQNNSYISADEHSENHNS